MSGRPFVRWWPHLLLAALIQMLGAPARVAAQNTSATPSSPARHAAPVAPAAPEPMQKNLQRGYFMLAAGIGLTAGGLVGIGMGAAKHACYGDTKPTERFMAPLGAGAALAGVGIALSFGGGFRIAGIPRDFRAKHPPGAGMVPLGLGVAAGAALTMFLVSLPASASCGAS